MKGHKGKLNSIMRRGESEKKIIKNAFSVKLMKCESKVMQQLQTSFHTETTQDGDGVTGNCLKVYIL